MAAKAIFKDVTSPTILLVRTLKGRYDAFGNGVYMKDIDERAISAIDTLEDIEADLVKYYFGYKDGKTHTLKECDEYINKNRGGATRIINKAIRKLKHPSRYKQIILQDPTQMLTVKKEKKTKVQPSTITGQIFGTLKVTNEFGKNNIECLCTTCGHKSNYAKPRVLAEKAKCSHCLKLKGLMNTEGQTFDTLKIINELGLGRVRCKCTNCEVVGEYSKTKVTNNNQQCNHCHKEVMNTKPKKTKPIKTIRKSDVEKMLGKFIVGEIVYELMGAAQYDCQCRKCRKVLILSVPEMVKHKC